MITIREKDIELYTSVSHGFRGFFDIKQTSQEAITL